MACFCFDIPEGVELPSFAASGALGGGDAPSFAGETNIENASKISGSPAGSCVVLVSRESKGSFSGITSLEDSSLVDPDDNARLLFCATPVDWSRSLWVSQTLLTCTPCSLEGFDAEQAGRHFCREVRRVRGLFCGVESAPRRHPVTCLCCLSGTGPSGSLHAWYQLLLDGVFFGKGEGNEPECADEKTEYDRDSKGSVTRKLGKIGSLAGKLPEKMEKLVGTRRRKENKRKRKLWKGRKLGSIIRQIGPMVAVGKVKRGQVSHQFASVCWQAWLRKDWNHGLKIGRSG